MAADPKAILWHNKALQQMAETSFDPSALRHQLEQWGMFQVVEFPSGLRPAATVLSDDGESAYRFAWLRDNIHLAYADLVMGRTGAAVRVFEAWLDALQRHIAEFGVPTPGRPLPVKLDGVSGEAPAATWSHRQNDAVGLFVWFAAQLMRNDMIQPTARLTDTITAIAHYLQAIGYASAADSGHWEEELRLNASSIGCVVAGATAWRNAALPRGTDLVFTDEFVTAGQRALLNILPWETPGADERPRRTDSALLFLIYPLEVVDEKMAEAILVDNATLHRQIGIARYEGDSYWAPDYRTVVPKALRAVDYSENIDARNKLARPGQEAQWTLFDPVVSAAHGRLYQRTGSGQHLQMQEKHLRRALAAITPKYAQHPGRLPEAYFLEDGHWVPNDHIPLRWAESMLELALVEMEKSLASAGT